MGPGQQGKRLLKAARKIPLQDVCEELGCRPGEIPAYFLLNQYGFEVIRGWSRAGGFFEISICDDALAVACSEYLRSLGLLFDSSEAATAYSQPHGWVEDIPQ
jgi:hypothetical protein